MAGKNLFSALFLSKEPFAPEVVKKLFEEYGVELHRAQNASEVDQWVCGRRLDLVLCDYDTPGVPQLACLQTNTHWRGISMVIVGGREARDIRGKRVHFTVTRPLHHDVLARGLKAAYTTMARQRIESWRHTMALRPLAGTLLFRGFQRALAHTSISNLSQTGLCLSGPEPLPQGGMVSVNFALPESDDFLHVIGTVVWSDATGRSGIQFNRISVQQQKKLHKSLKSRLPLGLNYLLPSE